MGEMHPQGPKVWGKVGWMTFEVQTTDLVAHLLAKLRAFY
jgi:hypothetical protein